eukprot:7388840-Prymnesium_polylepis.2
MRAGTAGKWREAGLMRVGGWRGSVADLSVGAQLAQRVLSNVEERYVVLRLLRRVGELLLLLLEERRLLLVAVRLEAREERRRHPRAH